jgi:hypothetical protein
LMEYDPYHDLYIVATQYLRCQPRYRRVQHDRSL